MAPLPVQACMVLRLEAEEVTQYNDDLDAERKRELLSALLASLDATLAFLCQVEPCVQGLCCEAEPAPLAMSPLPLLFQLSQEGAQLLF